MTGPEILRADIEELVALRKSVREGAGALDDSRIMALITASSEPAALLVNSLSSLILQARHCRTELDIVLALNNGYECPGVIDCLRVEYDAEILHLTTSPRHSAHNPAIIHREGATGKEQAFTLASSRNEIRLIVVHQRQGVHEAGKLRVLADVVCSLLLGSASRGWIPPELVLLLDAESHILCCDDASRPILGSNGLCEVLGYFRNNKGVDLVGTRVWFCQYASTNSDRQVDSPDLNAAIPAIYKLINAQHGNPGARWLPGGGTCGRFESIVSLLSLIGRKYPGSRVEDCHTTVLAANAPLRYEILERVCSTNRCLSPFALDSGDGQPLYLRQLTRWMKGIRALELLYGVQVVSALLPTTRDPEVFRLNPHRKLLYSAEARSEIGRARWEMAKAARAALKEPDVLVGEESIASWATATPGRSR